MTFLSNLQNCEVNRSLSFIFKVLQPWVFDNRLLQHLSVKTELSGVGVPESHNSLVETFEGILTCSAIVWAEFSLIFLSRIFAHCPETETPILWWYFEISYSYLSQHKLH